MTLPTDAKARKEFAMWTFLTEYFPDAIEAMVAVAVAGNRQHNPGEKLHWSRGKSMDQLDTTFRHMWDHKTVGPLDTDGCYHLAKAMWRIGAELQLTIERLEGKVPLFMVESGNDNQNQAVPQGAVTPEAGSARGLKDPLIEAIRSRQLD